MLVESQNKISVINFCRVLCGKHGKPKKGTLRLEISNSIITQLKIRYNNRLLIELYFEKEEFNETHTKEEHDYSTSKKEIKLAEFQRMRFNNRFDTNRAF